MILPIHIYGDPILRVETEDVTTDSPELRRLVDDLLETLDNARGLGLAAPQVGRKERVFVADLTSLAEHPKPGETTVFPAQPMVCINPQIVWESEEESEFEEGCLSIPGLYDTVVRPTRIVMHYLDRELRAQEIDVTGRPASVFQHETDHLDGVLYLDYLSPFRLRLLKRKLQDMTRGIVDADYPVSLPKKGKKG